MTSTAAAPRSRRAWAARLASSSVRTAMPVSASASWVLGVSRSARGSICSAKVCAASSASSGKPVLEIITGSTTIQRGRRRRSSSATVSIISASPSMPVLATPISRSSKTEAELGADDLSGELVSVLDAERVLGGNGGDHGGGVAAVVGGGGLDVGLDAGAGGGVGACDADDRAHARLLSGAGGRSRVVGASLVRSLRRHYPDQVQRVCSQARPASRWRTTPAALPAEVSTPSRQSAFSSLIPAHE